MKNNFSLYLIIIAGFLFGCGESMPRHVVVDSQSMKVYSVKTVNHERFGKYEYWVTDSTGYGWTFYSNQKLNIDDELIITKKKNNEN